MGDVIDDIIKAFRRRPRPKPPVIVPPPPPPPAPIPDVIIPSPEGARGPVRLTNGHNIRPIGMAYWRNINQHAGQDILEVVLSVDDILTIFTVSKRTLEVLGMRSLGIHHTGEGVCFSRHDGSSLYYGMGKEYLKYNIHSGGRETVWSSPYNLWQCHMDYREVNFSGTLKDDNWQIIGWGVNNHQFPIGSGLRPDECQIDKSGEWLCIKEIRSDDKLVNRFINVISGREIIIQAEGGAIGHSDTGWGYILGENSFSSSGGAVDFLDLNTGERRMIYATGTWNLGYVSCCNARPDRSEKFLISSADGRLILCDMNGQDFYLTQLQITNDYEIRPKANICPNGEFAVWTDARSGRLEAYLMRVD